MTSEILHDPDKPDVRVPPVGWKWRSSPWYITSVVALGTATDALAYYIIVPVLPFRLQALGYHNISSLTSWLMFSYSMGVCLLSLPVAYYFHLHPYRRAPLVIAVLLLEAAMVLFMLVKQYWIMVFARFLQGAASAVIWSVGFALICENVPQKVLGRYMGFAISGFSIGTVTAPPIGGALYSKAGWYWPFIFAIILLTIDLMGRILVVEKKTLRSYGLDRSSPEGQRAIATASNETSIEEEQPAREEDQKVLTPWGVLVQLVSSPRGVTALSLTVIYGLIVGALDPTLTLRVKDTWDKDAAFIGLIYLAAYAPAFIAGPISGVIADRFGCEWLAAPCLVLTAPWILLLMSRKSLPGFIVFFALDDFFTSCLMTPTGVEVAAVARSTQGIGEIHQFAAINVGYSLSSAIGAVIGGQMYDHLANGWNAVCWFLFGILILGVAPTMLYTGDKPLIFRLRGLASPAGVGH